MPSLAAAGVLLLSVGDSYAVTWWRLGRPAPLPAGHTSLRLAVDASYPPFASVMADGSLVGLEVDTARAISGELGLPLQLANEDTGSSLDLLVARTQDGILAQLAYDSRLIQTVHFTGPYFDDAPVLLSNKRAAGARQTVVAEAGSPLTPLAQQLQASGNRVAYTWDLPAAERDLAAHSGASLLVDRSRALEIVAAHKESELALKPLGSPGVYGFRAAMGRSNRYLALAVDEAIRRLSREGELQHIEDRWFGSPRGV